MSILDGLNERQLEAVTSTEGYVRVIAGAGSGKTKALAHRYAYLVKEGGIHPSAVLCVTFTNKAAGEMKKRVRSLAGEGLDTSLITTYHGFCVRVLRDDIGRLFWPDSFRIIDERDQKRILQEIYGGIGLKLDFASYEEILNAVEKFKSDESYVHLLTDSDNNAVNNCNNIPDPSNKAGMIEYVIRCYLRAQKKQYALDFLDLINFVFVLFAQFDEVKTKWQNRICYIQADEFQDSTMRELKLIDTIAEKNRNLFVVGDPDQNIYEWRGAKTEILINFDKSHSGTQTIIMNQNYRSTPNILNCANSLIEKNKNRIKKDLFSVNNPGAPVVHIHAENEQMENQSIVETIKKLHFEEKLQFGEIAVLYRASFLSQSVERALMAADIPYEIFGGTPFFSRSEIMDALAYFTLIVYDDDEAFQRIINIPRRRFGRAKLAHLKNIAELNNRDLYTTLKENIEDSEFKGTGVRAFCVLIEELRNCKKCRIPVSELLSRVLNESGYESYVRESGNMERFENIAELKRLVLEAEQSCGKNSHDDEFLPEMLTAEEFLRSVALMRGGGIDESSDRERVKLMTIHASKGLEFPAVILIGMNEGVMPSSRTLEERKNIGLEEERRLCFVALTRAKKWLFMTDSEGVNVGNGMKKLPSRFLFEINEDNYVRYGVISKELRDKTMKKTSDSNMIISREIGEKVYHVLFGPGEIVNYDEERQIYDVLFERLGKTKPISADYKFKDVNITQNSTDDIVEKAEIIIEKSSDITEKNSVEKPQAFPQPVEKPVEVQENDRLEASEEATQLELPISDNTLAPEIGTDVESAQDENIFCDRSTVEQKSVDEDDIVKNDNEDLITDDENDIKDNIIQSTDNLWNDESVPHEGWSCVGITDLGAPVGICAMCGKQIIRYVHHMKHQNYPRTLGCGCVCAGRMEGDVERAKRREAEFKNREVRRSNFVGKTRKKSKNGNEYVKYHGTNVTLLKDRFRNGRYVAVCSGCYTPSCESPEQALRLAFDILDPEKNDK